MYAIVQERDGELYVGGNDFKLYNNLEEAKSIFIELAVVFFSSHTKCSNIKSSLIPKLIDLKTDTIIYPSSNNIFDELAEIFKVYHKESTSNDNEQYNKAKALNEKFFSDIKLKIVS
jgi:hypothetical protein